MKWKGEKLVKKIIGLYKNKKSVYMLRYAEFSEVDIFKIFSILYFRLISLQNRFEFGGSDNWYITRILSSKTTINYSEKDVTIYMEIRIFFYDKYREEETTIEIEASKSDLENE
jgi:hypothetical protein